MQKSLATLLFLLCLGQLYSQLEGPNPVCKYDCETYYLSDSTFVFEFEVDNADIVDVIRDGDSILAIELCFNYDSTAVVELYGFNQEPYFYFIEVILPEKLDAEILDDIFPTGSSICLGQSISLQAFASGADYYSWVIDDGPTITGEFLSYSFDEPGLQTLSMIADGDCAISDTVSYEINVENKKAIELQCVGTSCQDSTNIYYATEECSQYVWSVIENGRIVDGGGSTDKFIEVEWGSADLGIISLQGIGCVGAICDAASVFTIPIISSSVNIFGPDEICVDERPSYSTYPFDGVDYNWTLSQNGRILGSSTSRSVSIGDFEIAFSALNSTALLELVIDNCELECSGYGSKEILIKRRIDIQGSSGACDDNATGFYRNARFPLTWDLIDPNGNIIQTETANNFDIRYTSGPGNYTIHATDSQNLSCEEDAFVYVYINPLPDALTSIVGPTKICLGEAYTYKAFDAATVLAQNRNYEIQWTLIDGTIERQAQGETVTQTWSSTTGPYRLEARVLDGITECLSLAVSLEVDIPTDLMIDGTQLLCADEIVTYEASSEFGLVTFDVVPSYAGAIVYEEDKLVEIHWYAAGQHKVKASTCGIETTLDVEVLPFPKMTTVIKPDALCLGETGQVTITTDVPAVTSVFGIDDFVGNGPTLNLPPGDYEVIMDHQGCISSDRFTIDVLPIPIAKITSPDLSFDCPPILPIRLIAMNAIPTYSYQWYKDGIPFGTDGDTQIVSDWGTYSVEITDSNGCSSDRSASILLEDLCLPGTCRNPNPAPCTADVDFDIVQGTYCNEYQFRNTTVDNVAGREIWNFFSPELGHYNSISAQSIIDVTFPSPGYYYIFLIASTPDPSSPGNFCNGELHKVVEVPLVANFYNFDICVGESMPFEDYSSFLPGTGITSWEWDFGDNDSGSANSSFDQNPEHIFSKAGTFDVTLTVTSTTGCIATITETVRVHDVPTQNIILDSQFCSGRSMTLTTDGNQIGLDYDWVIFNDLGIEVYISKARNPIYSFPDPGNYYINLTTTNEYGCTSLLAETVNVLETLADGDIRVIGNNPFCTGESVRLSAPAGDTYLWSDGLTDLSRLVDDSGRYTVTVTDINGCEYITSIVVTEYTPPTIKIYGSKGDGQLYDTEIDICERDDFTLTPDQGFADDYKWEEVYSNGFVRERATKYQLTQSDVYVSNEGTYQFKVSRTFNGCTSESALFTINVHAPPDSPMIELEGKNCGEDPVTLKVVSPDPNLTYTWSNGVIANSIVTEISGEYHVVATSQFGCHARSNNLVVRSYEPYLLMTPGCKEMCFPEAICLVTHEDIVSYQWYQDGVRITGPEGSVQDYVVQEPGEYHVVFVDKYGCDKVSDPLHVEAESTDQKLEGFVYWDENEDGIYNGIDQPIENLDICVTDILGSTICYNSDINGFFEAQDFSASAFYLDVDLVGTDYFASSDVLSQFLAFATCNEDLQVEIPLILNCISSTETQDVFFCPGEVLEYEGVVLTPGIEETFSYQTVLGCDSTLLLTAIELAEPMINLDLVHACAQANSGLVEITESTGISVEFSIDNVLYQSDPVFLDIAVGLNTLYWESGDGCQGTLDFEILQFPAPTITYDIQNTCANASLGVINVTTNSNIFLSLDGISFSGQTTFSDFPEGMHTIYWQDENLCIGEIDVPVEIYPVPNFDLVVDHICEAGNLGNLNIQTNENLEFSMDGSTFEPLASIPDLPSGLYELYWVDENGCDGLEPFEVLDNADFNFSLVEHDFCSDQASGGVEVVSTSTGYQISINGMPYEEVDNVFGLDAGSYTMDIITPSGCDLSETFTIESFPVPDVQVEISKSCVDEDSGVVTIIPQGNSYQYSIDGLAYVNDLQFPGLASGGHILEVVNAEGCITVYDINIEEVQAPDVNIATQNSCNNSDTGMITLDQIPSVMYAVDQQNDFSNQLQFENLSAGQHVLYIMDENSCTFEIEFLIESFNTLDLYAVPAHNCIGATNGQIKIIVDPTEVLNFSLNGGVPQSSNVFTDLASGLYEVYVELTNGCDYYIYLDIWEIDSTELNFVDPIIDCGMESVTLLPEIITEVTSLSYTWSNGSTATSLEVTESGTYAVEIQDYCGIKSYEWQIEFPDEDTSDPLQFPNVFIPEDNTANNLFMAYQKANLNIVDYSLRVYDRWGNLVFETKDYTEGWDGLFNGGEVNSGVYVFVAQLEAVFCGESKQIKKVGDVTLLR